MHSQWQSPLGPTATATTTATTTTTTTTTATNYNHNTGSSNKFQIQKPQPNKKKKKTQNLQQNPNPTDQSMTKLNQPSMARAVEDDEQRSATAPGRAELQIGEQNFRLVSSASNRNHLLRDRKRKRER